MQWLKFVVIVQAILIFVFIIVFMFQFASDELKGKNPYANATSMGGYLPSTSDSFDMSRFSKGAVVLLVVSVLELIIISKTFS